jgi:hypothetical protein
VARKPSVPIEDWIAPLDEWVRQLLLTSECPIPQQIDEDETFPFLVVRHPRLRSRIVTTWSDSSLKTLDRLVVANLATLKETRVLDELSEQHSCELAALLIDCQAKFEAWGAGEKTDVKALAAWLDRSPRDWQRHVALLAKSGPGQLRALKRRMSRINDAIEGFLKYARTLDRYLASDAIGHVEAAQDEIRQVRFREPDDLEQLRAYTLRSHAFVVDPKRYAIEKLTAYLVHVCQLDRNEAYVRVAKIGNHFWNWGVKSNERYDGTDKWKDAPAIRQHFARTAWSKNT